MARIRPCLGTKSGGQAFTIKFQGLGPMPRYFFDVKNGHRLVDPVGVDCKSEAQARRQGEAVAKHIAEESPRSVARKVAVVDDEGREVANVPIGNSNGQK